MSTTRNTTDLEAFQSYINEQHGGTLNGNTLDEAIEEFKKFRYAEQLAKMEEKIRLSEESAVRDGTRELPENRLDDLCDEWEQELRDEGAIK